MELILLYVVIGALTGLLAGLLGIGGGVITVPSLYYLLTWVGFPPDHIMHVSIGTALACTFTTSSASTWAHHQKKSVHWNYLGFMIPGLVIGCLSGVELAHFLSGEWLRRIFGGMAILIGLYFLFPKLPVPQFGRGPNPFLVLFGLFIGHLSSLLGVGGGIFTMPVLYGYPLPLTNAVATSSGATLVSSFVGTIAYLFVARGEAPLPGTFGYINVLAFVCISLGSVCTATIGAKLAHVAPTLVVKRIFAVALSVTGLAMAI